MVSNTQQKAKNLSSTIKSKKSSWEWKVLSEKNVSVITKTNTPKIIVQSEQITSTSKESNTKYKHEILPFLLKITMCLIVLITFFLSIKTYNIVNQLHLQLL